MTTTAEFIAQIAASIARREQEDARLAERAKAYTGPERRRARRDVAAAPPADQAAAAPTEKAP